MDLLQSPVFVSLSPPARQRARAHLALVLFQRQVSLAARCRRLRPDLIVSRVLHGTPRFLTLATVRLDICGSKTCQFVTSTLPWANGGIRCAGTRSRVR